MKRLEQNTIILWFSFLLVLAFTSCKTRQLLTEKKTETVTVTETLHDTVFTDVPDSSAIKALIECQNGKPVLKEIKQATPGRKLRPPMLNLKDNILSCDCYADSLKMYAFWKSKNTYKATEIQKPVLIEKQLTWWQTTQIWIGRILLLILLVWLLKTIYNPFKFLSENG